MARTRKLSIGKRKPAARTKPSGSTVRLPEELVSRIDAWASKHATPTRVEAIGKLVDLGLAATAPPSKSGRLRDRAATLAARQLDQMADTSATTEERANRKQRLTDGPSVFRKVRRDQGKTKASG